jgi:membrane protein implicated in regulation of membrane protease activity
VKVDGEIWEATAPGGVRAGDTVRVTIYRGKRKMDVNVTLGEAREQV